MYFDFVGAESGHVIRWITFFRCILFFVLHFYIASRNLPKAFFILSDTEAHPEAHQYA